MSHLTHVHGDTLDEWRRQLPRGRCQAASLSCCSSAIEERSPQRRVPADLPPRSAIVIEGDHTDTVFVLLRGRVKVSLDTADRW